MYQTSENDASSLPLGLAKLLVLPTLPFLKSLSLLLLHPQLGLDLELRVPLVLLVLDQLTKQHNRLLQPDQSTTPASLAIDSSVDESVIPI